MSILLIGIFLTAIKLPLLPFDSDQAIVGLMGKHILEGAFPWLYYGDSYSGTLEPGLAACSFLFFGVSRWALHLIPGIFTILFTVSIYQLGRELYNRVVGLVGMLLAAVPLFSMGFYPPLAYGGYIEVLWLGNLILLLTHRVSVRRQSVSGPQLFFLGLLGGIAWWTYPISAVYSITSGVLLLFFRPDLFRRGRFLLPLPAFFLGGLPFWVWNAVHQFPFLAFSTGAENPDYLYRVQRFLREFLEFFNPNNQPLLTPLTLIAAAFFLASLLYLLLTVGKMKSRFPNGRGPVFLLSFFLIFSCFYIGSRFSEQNAARYLLPLFSLVPLSLAILSWRAKSRKGIIGVGMIALFVAIHGYHQFSLHQYLKQTSFRYQKQLEVEENLFGFLRQKQFVGVYMPEYWGAAELTFNGREAPVFSLPFRDRYPLNTLRADAQADSVFVLDGKYPESFEFMFRAMGGGYEKRIISLYPGIKGYVVYHGMKPLNARSEEIVPQNWKGQSNLPGGGEERVFDRNRFSYWSSQGPQKAGVYFQVDLKTTYVLNRLVFLCAKGREWDFPAYYRVELSADEKTWREVAMVQNNWAYLFWSGGRPFWKLREGRMEIAFSPREARYLRLTITHPAPQSWSIGEIFVYEHKSQGKIAPTKTEEILAFLEKEGLDYVYADIGLSARLTRLSRGKIKCLQDDYDITQGEDYARRGYNGTFPYFNGLKREVDFSLKPAFIVAEENHLAMARILSELEMIWKNKPIGDQVLFFDLKSHPINGEGPRRKPASKLYWTGTHLLTTSPLPGF
ncbi:MAG: discoidin domain-containing protein [Thermodesulfobacteriota bacterium]